MGLRTGNSLNEHFALPLVTSPLKLGRRDRKGGAELKDWLAEWKDRTSPLTYHLSIQNRTEDCNFLVNALSPRSEGTNTSIKNSRHQQQSPVTILRIKKRGRGCLCN